MVGPGDVACVGGVEVLTKGGVAVTSRVIDAMTGG